jgi:hypothetical protein
MKMDDTFTQLLVRYRTFQSCIPTRALKIAFSCAFKKRLAMIAMKNKLKFFFIPLFLLFSKPWLIGSKAFGCGVPTMRMDDLHFND